MFQASKAMMLRNSAPMLFATTTTVAVLTPTEDTNGSQPLSIPEPTTKPETDSSSKMYNITSYASHLSLTPASLQFNPNIRTANDDSSTTRSRRLGNAIQETDPVIMCLPAVIALIGCGFLASPTRLARNGLHKSSYTLGIALYAAAIAGFQSESYTWMDVRTTSAEATSVQQPKFGSCESYGRPLLPQDILYKPVQQALEQLRNTTKEKLRARSSSQDLLVQLESSGDEMKATLTLVGYKGGELKDQVNQDRAMVISPYLSGDKDTPDLETSRIMGIFDGHATYGERVSEYCATELPKLLAQKLGTRMTAKLTEIEEEQMIVATLKESFIELDKTAPDGESGGCTASVMFQMGHKLYVANTGDSRSFLCVHHSTSNVTDVVYITREDKPDLPDERARVESMGGEVWVPSGPGAARVLFTDPATGDQTGIAMSRSIGDRDVGKFGVIPDPIVDVIDLAKLIQERRELAKSHSWFSSFGKQEEEIDDIHLFAVSASDGMMDVLNPKGIARFLVPSLCEPNGEHLLTACEKLISTAADGWQRASDDGRYRDDIAISVSKLRTPPVTDSRS